MKKLVFALLVSVFPLLQVFAQSFSGQSAGDVRVVSPYRFCLGPDNGTDVCLSQSANGQMKSVGGMNPQSLGGISYYASQYPGSDLGAQVNNAIAACPSTGCEIIMPGGDNQFSTQIVISKYVHLRGAQSTLNAPPTNSATVLDWRGGAIPAIVVNAASAGASGTVLADFQVTNGGASGTIGIDVTGNQYDFEMRNVSIQPQGAPFSVAGVRLGFSGGPLVNPRAYNLRIGNQTTGLQLLYTAAFNCFSCSIYNNTTANVQVGDATHTAYDAVFYGGNIEQDALSLGTDLVVNAVEGLNFFGVYTETRGENWLSVPNTATNARGMRVYGGRVNMNSVASSLFSLNYSGADLLIDGLAVRNIAASSNLVLNTSSAFVHLLNVNTDAAITLASGSTSNVFLGSSYLNGALSGLQYPNGTDAAPTYSFSSQPTFGWYLPQVGVGNPNRIGLAQGGAERAAITSSLFLTTAGGVFGWSNTSFTEGLGPDTGLSRDALNVVDVGNGTSGDISGTLRLTQTRLKPQTFASLPSCSAGLEGSLQTVTDSTTATYNATITGGGTNHIMAYCNATNWVAH